MLITLTALVIFIHVFYFWALATKNFGVMDIAWGLGFVLISILTYFQHPLHLKNAILLIVVSLWGLRLAWHIFKRNVGHREDFRYAQLRSEWGSAANLQAYFKVFIFQGLLMLLISTPITFGMGSEMKWINWVGLFVWFFGWSIECYSDHYLKKFKSVPSNSGKICMSGPWSYSRFPNYLGEIILWYGIYLIGFSFSASWTFISPIILNFLILKVTGVPFLENKYMSREDYKLYAKKVSRLVPFV
jgi:steroid 5-alpha reductase family enzyme